MTSAAIVRQQALARKAAGDDAGAARLFAEGLTAFPGDAAFANSAGNFHASAGRPAEALALFDRALTLNPTLHEAAINRAVVLPRLGRAHEATSLLRTAEASLGELPRYWTTRAAAELADGEPGAAAVSYDAALQREPANARALHGRARASLERGEERAVADHERALTATPGDPHLLVGYAHALAAAGLLDEALTVAHSLATQLPNWTDGLELFAALRWASGEGSVFVDHYPRSAATNDAPAIYQSWAGMLSGVDRHGDAADVLAAARLRWPEDASLALAEAIAAGEAGDGARADALFEQYRCQGADWAIAEGRHKLRQGDPAAAEKLLAGALLEAPENVAAWGLRDLCWRLLDDQRHEWLHGQQNLVRMLSLDLSDAQFDRARRLLTELHDRSAMPIGQSVKRGTQTRGALFHRTEPELTIIAQAISRALDLYRRDLPPGDPDHPLLRHRDGPWRVAGSWSIRLSGVGHHAPHIHPRGILSSAAYFEVPTQVAHAGQPGWLELGRPPAELQVDLPPLALIKPEPGQCALFPSTMFHGTRPITAGLRMTVAFDVAGSIPRQ